MYYLSQMTEEQTLGNRIKIIQSDVLRAPLRPAPFAQIRPESRHFQRANDSKLLDQRNVWKALRDGGFNVRINDSVSVIFYPTEALTATSGRKELFTGQLWPFWTPGENTSGRTI